VYYKPALSFFNEIEICFILLHEEYHCITPGGGTEFDATNYASKKIMEYDDTINLLELKLSINKHRAEYQKTAL